MSSAANSVARKMGLTLKTAMSVEKAAQLSADGTARLWLVDLQMAKLQPDKVGESLRAMEDTQRPSCVAYAQHVEIELLRAAKDQPFDEVLTRGQIHGGLEAIFEKYVR